MTKLLFIFILIILIFFIFWKKNRNIGNKKKSNFYKNLLIGIVVLGILFFIATSGKFILPQIIQIIKMFLPLITKLIAF